MRRLHAAAFLVLGALAHSPAVAQTPVWPVQGPAREILHGFQNPLNIPPAFLYFHEGVDVLGDTLQGPTNQVFAMRGGLVRYVSFTDAGGTVLVEVTLPSGGQEWDSYLHVSPQGVSVGATLQTGDVIGVINASWFTAPFADHLHVNRFSSYAGSGNGYLNDRDNMLDPLRIFAGQPAEQDPQTLAPTLADVDGDGRAFVIRSGANPEFSQSTVPYEYAWGPVDLHVDLGDDLSAVLYQPQNPLRVGYWIEAFAPGGVDVASAAAPYVLCAFDDAWRVGFGSPTSLSESATVTAALDAYRIVDRGTTNTGWNTALTFRVTNASGTTGGPRDVDATQFWRTDAAGLAVRANGSDAPIALEISEASFPDGRYDVHVLVGDALGTVDEVRTVHVDNFRPYVRELVVQSTVTPGEYRATRQWDAIAQQLDLVPNAPVSPTFSTTGDLLLTVRFSEPVTSAAVVDVLPSVGYLPPLAPVPGTNRTTWAGTIPAAELADDGSEDGLHRLFLRAVDDAGSRIWPIRSNAPLPGGFNKRTDAAPIEEPTHVDSAHSFVLG